jgi:hypothetical protein
MELCLTPSFSWIAKSSMTHLGISTCMSGRPSKNSKMAPGSGSGYYLWFFSVEDSWDISMKCPWCGSAGGNTHDEDTRAPLFWGVTRCISGATFQSSCFVFWCHNVSYQSVTNSCLPLQWSLNQWKSYYAIFQHFQQRCPREPAQLRFTSQETLKNLCWTFLLWLFKNFSP